MGPRPRRAARLLVAPRVDLFWTGRPAARCFPIVRIEKALRVATPPRMAIAISHGPRRTPRQMWSDATKNGANQQVAADVGLGHTSHRFVVEADHRAIMSVRFHRTAPLLTF